MNNGLSEKPVSRMITDLNGANTDDELKSYVAGCEKLATAEQSVMQRVWSQDEYNSLDKRCIQVRLRLQALRKAHALFLKQRICDYTVWYILSCVEGNFEGIFDLILQQSKGMADKFLDLLGSVLFFNPRAPKPIETARRVLALWDEFLQTTAEIQKSGWNVPSGCCSITVDSVKPKFATRVAATIDIVRQSDGAVEANEFSKRLLN